MSAASQAGVSGAVLGIVIIFLLQQFGYISLSTLLPSLIYFVVAAVVLGVVFGLAAHRAGRRPKTAS